MKKLSNLLFCFVLAGCTFSSSQLDTVTSVFQRPEILPEHYWILELQGQKIPLVAVVENPPFTSYVNAEGISINHDGRDITSVYGWPEDLPEVRIVREGNMLTHRLRDGLSVVVHCSEWVLVEPMQWQLKCQSETGLRWAYTNEVKVNESGRITRLHYSLWPGLSPIDLVWFPVSGESVSLLGLSN